MTQILLNRIYRISNLLYLVFRFKRQYYDDSMSIIYLFNRIRIQPLPTSNIVCHDNPMPGFALMGGKHAEPTKNFSANPSKGFPEHLTEQVTYLDNSVRHTACSRSIHYPYTGMQP